MEGGLGGGEGGVRCVGGVDEGGLEGRVREDVGEVRAAVGGRGDGLVLSEGRRVRWRGPYDLSFRMEGSQPSSGGGMCTGEDPLLSCDCWFCWCGARSGNGCLESWGGGGGGGRGGPPSCVPCWVGAWFECFGGGGGGVLGLKDGWI